MLSADVEAAAACRAGQKPQECLTQICFTDFKKLPNTISGVLKLKLLFKFWAQVAGCEK